MVNRSQLLAEAAGREASGEAIWLDDAALNAEAAPSPAAPLASIARAPNFAAA